MDDEVCSVSACGKPVHNGRGWCRAHYMRWRAHGSPTAGSTPKGAAPKFLQDVVLPYTGDDCLAWPYSKDRYGRGQIGIGGKRLYVHRIVCEELYGPPPSSRHHAAHSCGKGHLGCVNPVHLRWATPAENNADKLMHGTHNRGERCGTAKLTEAQVRQIRASEGKSSQRALAEKFGVSTTSIHLILNRTNWAHVS